jgi:hypothetical protein
MDTPEPTAANTRRQFVGAVVVLAIIAAAYHARRRFGPGRDRFTIEQTHAVVSSVDGMRYRVHEGHAGPQRAADTLARLNARIIDLMRHLRGRYLRGGGDGLAAHPQRREAVLQLLARYNPDNLAENSPKDPSGDTSYTIDKGAVVAICLRDRDPGGDSRIHDIDTLTFVTLHEMAHIAIKDIDHPPRFWSAFRFILEEAEAAGVYTSPRYEQAPRQYCGVKIDYNPRYDPANPAL